MIEIDEATDILSECVYEILYEDLIMGKLSAQSVPRMMTVDQNRVWLDILQECLKRNPNNILRCFVISYLVRLGSANI